MEIEGKTEKEFSPVPGPSTNKKVRKELLTIFRLSVTLNR